MARTREPLLHPIATNRAGNQVCFLLLSKAVLSLNHPSNLWVFFTFEVEMITGNCASNSSLLIYKNDGHLNLNISSPVWDVAQPGRHCVRDAGRCAFNSPIPTISVTGTVCRRTTDELSQLHRPLPHHRRASKCKLAMIIPPTTPPRKHHHERLQNAVIDPRPASTSSS